MTSATLFREGTDLDTVLAGLDAEHPGQVHVVEVTYGRDGGMLGFFARRSVGVRYTLDGAPDKRPIVKRAAERDVPRHAESTSTDSTLEDLLRAAEAAEMVESGRPVARRTTSDATAADDAPNVEFARMLLDIAAAKAAERQAAEEPAEAPVEPPALPIYDAIDAAIAERAERLSATPTPVVASPPTPPSAPTPPAAPTPPPAAPVAWSAPPAPAVVWSAPPPRTAPPTALQTASQTTPQGAPQGRPADEDPELIERLDIEVLVKRARTRPIGAHRVPPPEGAHSMSAAEGAHRVPATDGAHRVPPGEDHYRVPPIDDAYRPARSDNGVRLQAPVEQGVRTSLTLRRQLAEMGVPVAWIPNDSADAFWIIERLVDLLPAAPRLDLGPGQLIVIAGPAADAMRAAAQVCARLRMNPADIRAAGCPDGTVPPELMITHRWEAGNCAADIRRAHAAPAVIVVATDNQSGDVEDDWAGGIVAALAPEQLWLVVDATCKPADGRRLVGTIGPVDALVVNGSARTASPASVWDLHLPVALLDGRPATRGAWAVLLVDKLAALDA